MGNTVSREHAKLPFGYTHPRKDHSFNTSSVSRRRLTRILRPSDTTSVTPFPIQDGTSSVASIPDQALLPPTHSPLQYGTYHSHHHQNSSINSNSASNGSSSTDTDTAIANTSSSTGNNSGGEWASLSSVPESGTDGQPPLVPESALALVMRSLPRQSSSPWLPTTSTSNNANLPRQRSSTIAGSPSGSTTQGSVTQPSPSTTSTFSKDTSKNHNTCTHVLPTITTAAAHSSSPSSPSLPAKQACLSTSTEKLSPSTGMQEGQDTDPDIISSLGIADHPSQGSYNFFSSTASTCGDSASSTSGSSSSNSSTCGCPTTKDTRSTSPSCSPRMDAQHPTGMDASLLFIKGSSTQPQMQGDDETLVCSCTSLSSFSHGHANSRFPRSDFRGHPASSKKVVPYEIKVSTRDPDLQLDDEQDFMASTWEDGNMHCPGEADSILDEELGQLSPIPFSELPSLTNIGMCSQGIVKLSSNIRFLASATCVQICCNELSMIPAEIGYLRNLTLLDLSKNNLTTLPDTIMNLTKLVDLKLSFNQLKSIPAGIGGLTKLVALALDNNQLESIPRQIGSIKGLVSLDLSNNPIKVLPAEVGKLQFLRRLILERCPLVDEFRHSPLYSPPTLLELAARVMVRHDVPVPARLPPHLKDYLKTARTCTYCEGPFFESSVTRGKMVEKNEVYIPLEYTLCVPHWNTELERVKLMFCKRPITAPPIKPSSGSQTTVGHISISRKPPSRSESASRITGPSSPGSGTLNGQQAIGVSSSSSSSSPNNNSNGNGGNGRRMTADNNDRPLSAVIGNRLSMLLYLKGDNNGNSNNNSNNSGSNNNKRERPTSRFRASSQPVVSSMRSSNLAPGGGSSSSNTTPTTPTTTTAPTVVRNTNGTEENSASRPSARRATTNGILSRAVFRLKRPLSMASAMETTSVPIGHTEEASSTSVTDSE